MSPPSSHRPRCSYVPRAFALLALLVVEGCGRIGYDSLSSRQLAPGDDGSGPGDDPTTEADSGDGPYADGGESDARAAPPRADGGPIDSGAVPTGADAQMPVCAPCGLGESCIAGSCVAECDGTYAGAVSCQSFEDGLTGLTYTAGATAESSLVHTGAGSLRTQSSGASVTSHLSLALSPALTSGALYFRGYYYIETPRPMV